MWKLKIAEGEGPWLTSTNGHLGRQYWEFDPDAGTPEERAQVEAMRLRFNNNRFRFKQSADLLMRMQLRKENLSSPIPEAVKLGETEQITEEATIATLRRAITYFSTIQSHDGHWPAELAGSLFFLAPMVLALYITGAMNDILSSEHQKEIKRYIYNHQNEDGGWGLHIEGHSTMFGSVFNYVTLRLLGEDGDDNSAVSSGRKWILDHGGAVGIPSWGKFWLTVLGVYEWDGCNPMPPEFWLLPIFSPIHPGKMMSLCRLVYMPMSYLYGKRFVGPITGLIRSLRQEIYTQPYGKINWNGARNTCSKEDLYYPHPFVQDMLWGFLYHFIEPLLKRWPFSKLRDKALRIAIEHAHYEDENTRYLCIGSIEKASSMLASWVEDPNSDAYKCHLARVPDYLWVAEDGMKVVGSSSQTWDVAFAIQAILSSNLFQEYGPTLRKAHAFLMASQVRDNSSGDFRKMYRHICKGAWTFSVQDHGWQVSDCTAEGLKAALLLSQMPQELVGEAIEIECLYDAVNIILSLQSASGGFPAWEPKRAHRWVEKFNPTEFFEDVVIERENFVPTEKGKKLSSSYVECTSSAIQALVLFKKLHPAHRREEIESCITRAIQYIENTQESDGSWYGCWGICYTYGTWFGVEALVACGNNYHNSPTVRKACEFLLSKQLPDGGWGESFLSCSKKVYTNLEGNKSNLVQTSWALLSLIKAGQGDVDPLPIHHGMRLLINSQMNDGDFPQQEVTGVFMKTCELNYSSYRNIFPIWALGEYRQLLRA